MEIVNTISGIRGLVKEAKAAGKRVGLVPTMGALHAGHVSLIEAAVEQCDFVVVSIFVNPTQFGPGEDYEKYPRDLDEDAAICRKAGVDAIFAPEVGQMYPDENITWVTVDKLTENLCGKGRPGHFRGVTTVCSKLFNIVGADAAFFGQKDAQQASVIKRMAADLNIPLEIVVCPTVREGDGLAVSSRNKYLSETERKDATLLYKSLAECEKMVAGGEYDCSKLIGAIRKVLGRSGKIEIEYVNIVDCERLEDIDTIKDKALVAIAAEVGSTRLIDNILIDLNNQQTVV